MRAGYNLCDRNMPPSPRRKASDKHCTERTYVGAACREYVSGAREYAYAVWKWKTSLATHAPAYAHAYARAYAELDFRQRQTSTRGYGRANGRAYAQAYAQSSRKSAKSYCHLDVPTLGRRSHASHMFVVAILADGASAPGRSRFHWVAAAQPRPATRRAAPLPGRRLPGHT